MRKVIAAVLCVSTLVALVASSSASASADPTRQFNYEAGFRVDTVPTSDPCVIGFAGGDVLDFIDRSLTDMASVSFGLRNVCAGPYTPLYNYVTGFVPIAESAFTVSQSTTADLRATFVAFDMVAQVEEPITVDLHFESPPGVMRDAAVVTGTFTSPRVTVELDESIVWNEWAILSDPDTQPPVTVAGLWLCNFPVLDLEKPGCIGQVR